MDNTGDMPLPSKVGGEGKLDSAYMGPSTVGSNGQGPAPSGTVMQPTGSADQGTSGHGSKEENSLPQGR